MGALQMELYVWLVVFFVMLCTWSLKTMTTQLSLALNREHEAQWNLDASATAQKPRELVSSQRKRFTTTKLHWKTMNKTTLNLPNQKLILKIEWASALVPPTPFLWSVAQASNILAATFWLEALRSLTRVWGCQKAVSDGHKNGVRPR